MRKSKIPTAPPGQRKSSSSKDRNLSLMDPTAFMEGLQSSHGRALHSTALEEDLEAEEAEHVNEGKEKGKEVKGTDKQQGAAAKKKMVTETGGEKKKKKSVRSEERGTAKRKKSRDQLPVSPDNDPSNMSHQPRPPRPTAAPGRGRGRGRGSGRTAPVRPRKEQQTISKETRESDGDSSDMESLMMNPHNTSECPSPKKPGSVTPEEEAEERSKRVGRQATAPSHVVLDTLQDFCDEYKGTVQSRVVRVAIDAFYTHVEDQILEKMSTDKELKVLKRANAKLASAMRTKTQRLLGAKYELRSAERKVSLLQKQETEMKQRLDDLKRSVAFLQDLRGLNQNYLLHRRKHPKEKETYTLAPSSSLPLQLEVEQSAPRLKWMNKKMEKKQT